MTYDAVNMLSTTHKQQNHSVYINMVMAAIVVILLVINIHV